MSGRLCLSETDRKIAGVCGGIAEYFHFEPAFVRIIWILLILLFKLMPIVIYILLWAILPSNHYEF